MEPRLNGGMASVSDRAEVMNSFSIKPSVAGFHFQAFYCYFFKKKIGNLV